MAPREFYENKANAALQSSQKMLTTPVPGTNCRLEKVGRIVIRTAEEVLEYLDRGDDAISSAKFTAAWDHFAAAVSALNYLSLQSRESEKAIHDLKAMHTHYLSLKYQYHRHKAHQELQRRSTPGPVPSPKGRDFIGELEQDIASHLLLGKKWWARKSVELQQELHRLRQWEQHGHPKSKAPPAPKCTWLMGLLDLFYLKDPRTAAGIIRYALATTPEPFKAMSRRHATLVQESRDQLALDEIDSDLGLLTVWVPKEYDTEVLETAIFSHKNNVLSYRHRVTQYKAWIARLGNGV